MRPVSNEQHASAGRGETVASNASSEDDVSPATEGSAKAALLTPRPARTKLPRPRRREFHPDRCWRLRDRPRPGRRHYVAMVAGSATAERSRGRPLSPAGDFRLGFAGFIVASIPITSSSGLSASSSRPSIRSCDILQPHPGPAMLWLRPSRAVIVAPVTEEFLFRVVLQGWLESSIFFRVVLQRSREIS